MKHGLCIVKRHIAHVTGLFVNMNQNWARGILFGLLILLLTDCDRRKELAELQKSLPRNTADPITASSAQPDALPQWKLDHFGDILELERCVKLDANSDSLISYIGDLELIGERFFILDRNQETVMCFDKNGRFLFQVGKNGQGPGEYDVPFSICEYEGGVAVFSVNCKALLYSYDGTWLKSMDFHDVNMLTRPLSFLYKDRAYLCNFFGMHRDVPRHAIVDISSETLKPLWGFGTRPSWNYDSLGYPKRDIQMEGVAAFCRVGNQIWTCPMLSSVIETYDLDGRPISKLKPGFDGCVPEDFVHATSDAEINDLRALKPLLAYLLPIQPYVIAGYTFKNKTTHINIYDYEGHLIKRNLDRRFFPIGNGHATNGKIVIAYALSDMPADSLRKLLGAEELNALTAAGINIEHADQENPCLFIYHAKPPRS